MLLESGTILVWIGVDAGFKEGKIRKGSYGKDDIN
jgi:hypothetical protein